MLYRKLLGDHIKHGYENPTWQCSRCEKTVFPKDRKVKRGTRRTLSSILNERPLMRPYELSLCG